MRRRTLLLMMLTTACGETLAPQTSESPGAGTAPPVHGSTADPARTAIPNTGPLPKSAGPSSKPTPAPATDGLRLRIVGTNNYRLPSLPRANPLPRRTPSRVDLSLRIENPTDAPIHVKLTGDHTALVLTLEAVAGAGGIQRFSLGGDPTEIFMCGRWATIAPSAHVDIPLKELRHGDRAEQHGVAWTSAGTYRMTAAFRTTTARGSTPPEDCDHGTSATLTSRPFTIDVR